MSNISGSIKRKDHKGRILRKGESQRKDLRYMYRWTNSKGNMQCIYDYDLNSLRKEEARIANEIALGIVRENITLNEQIEKYLHAKSNLKASTLNNYYYFYKHFIKNSVLGNKLVRDIKKSDILMFYNDVYEMRVKAGSIQILHKVIHPALQLAVDDDLLHKNPSDSCMKSFSDDSDKKYALSLNESIEFLNRVKQTGRIKRYYPLFAILLKSGMRIGECIGLTWNDVLFEEKLLVIDHQVQYRQINGHQIFFATDTKTESGCRKIPMDEELYNLFMDQHKIWVDTKKDNDFEIDGYRNFVFLSHITGRCIYPGNIRRMMKRIVEMNDTRKINLPHVSPHILRHTACTRMAEAGYDIAALQYVIGQTDLETTMQRYNHVTLERVRKEVEKRTDLHNIYTKNE